MLVRPMSPSLKRFPIHITSKAREMFWLPSSYDRGQLKNSK